MYNGATLGVGASTRIGFWLWYVVPFAALLFGNPLLGAMIYGTYATVRGMAVWGILLVLPYLVGEDTHSWLVSHIKSARLVTASLLVLLAVVSAIIVGI